MLFARRRPRRAEARRHAPASSRGAAPRPDRSPVRGQPIRVRPGPPPGATHLLRPRELVHGRHTLSSALPYRLQRLLDHTLRRVTCGNPAFPNARDADRCRRAAAVTSHDTSKGERNGRPLPRQRSLSRRLRRNSTGSHPGHQRRATGHPTRSNPKPRSRRRSTASPITLARRRPGSTAWRRRGNLAQRPTSISLAPSRSFSRPRPCCWRSLSSPTTSREPQPAVAVGFGRECLMFHREANRRPTAGSWLRASMRPRHPSIGGFCRPAAWSIHARPGVRTDGSGTATD